MPSLTVAMILAACSSGQITSPDADVTASPPAAPTQPAPTPPEPTAQPAQSQLPAFPGAEGFGAVALGDCRQFPVVVHRVKNTDNSGPGSLRYILVSETASNQFDIVLFDTGGTITLSTAINLNRSCIYIAGQTAPGGGIQLRGPADPGHANSLIQTPRDRLAHDIVMRYFRARNGRGEEAKGDNIKLAGSYNMVLDHISTAFDNDKSIPISPADLSQGALRTNNISIQWSIISTSLAPHSTGMNMGPNRNEPPVDDISIHHNAFIHNSHRNPLIRNVRCAQIVNNLVYNWKSRAGRSYGDTCIDYIGNYYKRGPWSDKDYLEHGIETHSDPNRTATEDPVLYMFGNIADPMQKNPNGDQRNLVRYAGEKDGPLPASAFVAAPNARPSIPVGISDAAAAYDRILDGSGASHRLTCSGDWVDARDELDALLISHVRSGNGPADQADTDHQSDYGGFPSLGRGSACDDTDGDGMPDAYETRYDLDPSDASDSKLDADGDGYLNIEEYVNGERP